MTNIDRNDRPSLLLLYRKAGTGPELTCECGHTNTAPPVIRSARGFCTQCDRPLFYTRVKLPRRRAARSASMRRPEVKGIKRAPVLECQTCGEKNEQPPETDRATAICHRDGAPLYPDQWRAGADAPSEREFQEPSATSPVEGRSDVTPGVDTEPPSNEEASPSKVLGYVLGIEVLALAAIVLLIWRV